MAAAASRGWQRFDRGKQIGEGTFGTVFEGVDRQTGHTVAIKRFHPQWMSTRQGVHFTALREIRHLKALRHENIIDLVDVIARDGDGLFCLVFECCVGDLEDVIRRPELTLRPGDVKAYTWQLLSAVGFLHDRCILHRDLKPGNVLVAPDGRLKLADFGTARSLDTVRDGNMTPNIVTRWYQSPELLLGARRYGPAVDVWSVGCIVAELFLRRAVFPGTSTLDQLLRVCAVLGSPTHEAADWPDCVDLPDYVPMKPLPPRPLAQVFATGVASAAGATVPSRDALELMGAMLKLSPARRVSCDDALCDEYFDQPPRPTPNGDLPLARFDEPSDGKFSSANTGPDCLQSALYRGAAARMRRVEILSAAALACLAVAIAATPPWVTVPWVCEQAVALLTSNACVVGAPVAYARLTMAARNGEPLGERLLHTCSVTAVALWLFQEGRGDWAAFAVVCAVVLASYAVAQPMVVRTLALTAVSCLVGASAALGAHIAVRTFQGAAGAGAATLAWSAVTPAMGGARAGRAAVALCAGAVAAVWATAVVDHLLPLSDLARVYAVAAHFAGPQFHAAAARLALVTVHCQLPLGHLGIAYLQMAQARRNLLVGVGTGGGGSGDGTRGADGNGDGTRGGDGSGDGTRGGDGSGDGLPRSANMQADVAASPTTDVPAARTAGGAGSFARNAVLFILVTAVPYFLQRATFTTLNELALGQVLHSVETGLRVNAVLADGAALTAAAASSRTVDAHAVSLRGALDSAFHLVERKVFSLPKLALLPAVAVRHPRVLAGTLPVIVLIDAGKARLVAAISGAVEALDKKARELASKRTRLEAHDTANADALRRAGGLVLARESWSAAAGAHDVLKQQITVLVSVRNWIRWLYWSDVLGPLIECALAFLLEAGHMAAADIHVYARAIEDSVDTLLTRSRAESDLARLRSDAEQLEGLAQDLDAERARVAGSGLRCSAQASAGGGLEVDAAYVRRDTHVRVPGLKLPRSGVFAVVGANGSGKSTFFSLLMACRDGVLPRSIVLSAPANVTLPDAVGLAQQASAGGVTMSRSSPPHVQAIVEVGQSIYCPLYTTPIAWLSAAHGPFVREVDLLDRVESLAEDLGLHLGEDTATVSDTVCAAGADGGSRCNTTAAGQAAATAVGEDRGPSPTRMALLREHSDLCGSLSGGQRVKLELIRAVLSHGACPPVLLLDEVLAPLDPASKSSVQRQLAAFCRESLVLVIYHAESHHHGGMAEGATDDVHGTDDAAGTPSGSPPMSEIGVSEGSLCARLRDLSFDGAIAFRPDGDNPRPGAVTIRVDRIC